MAKASTILKLMKSVKLLLSNKSFKGAILNKKKMIWHAFKRAYHTGDVRFIQGGSIKTLLRFGGKYFRIEIRFLKNKKIIIIYVIFSIHGDNFITNKACVAKIRIFVQMT